MAKGTVHFEVDHCKGCGLCVSVCPEKSLALDERVINRKGYHPAVLIAPETCIGCAICALLCPDQVITVEKW